MPKRHGAHWADSSPLRTKNFYSPARPQCQKNLQPPLRTKMIPLDNKARPSGQNNPCTHPWDTKFTWFPWDYEKIKLSEADKKCKKNQPRKKKAWVGCKKGAKIFSGYFPLYLGSLNFIRVFPARLYTNTPVYSPQSLGSVERMHGPGRFMTPM